jgi:hypothetical protein
MPKLLDILGITENPFASYSAENEPDIDRYFVRPPYYSFVDERGQSTRSLLLFGARGAGKSATRLTIYKETWRRVSAGQKAPLTITIDDFSRVLADGLAKVDLGKFIAEIGFLVAEALLLWLSGLEADDRETYLNTLDKNEEQAAIALVQQFYLARPEFLRNSTLREPLKLLNQAWTKRTALWIAKKWDAVADLVATIAQSIAKKATHGAVDAGGSLATLLKSDRSTWNDAHFARTILVKLVDLSRQFGFSGLTIQVDKADETQQTNNSALATATLVYPLLANVQLLEIEGCGWQFFLWDKVRDEYTSDRFPVRLDKIANSTIAWEESFLANLIERRLAHFSSGAISTFDDLCEPTADPAKVLPEFVRLSMKSPRELIRVLDTVIREHDEEFASDASSPKLVNSTIDRALDKYSVETVRRMFDRVDLQQIYRLKLQTFVNHDVQQAFRINDQSARNRIRRWVDAGIVAHTGTRAAEGNSGGKPSYEYSIVDSRVKRTLERTLSLGADFDAAEEADPSAT